MIHKLFAQLLCLAILCLPAVAHAEDGYISWGDGSVIATISGLTTTSTTNYSIYVRGRVSPKIIQVPVLNAAPIYPATDPTYHIEDQLNPVPPPVYPATFGRRIWCTQGMDYYSDDFRLRAELWEDSTGLATWSDIRLMFPELPGKFETAARQWASAQAKAITTPYSVEEQQTWPLQRADAVAWLADNNAPTPYIDGLAAMRNIPRETFIQKVRENVDLFEYYSKWIFGNQQAFIDLIHDSTSLGEILDAAAALGINLWEVQL